MNIIVTGTKVTLDNRTLAFQKNNLVDTMTITVDTDETWQYKLDVKYPCKDGEGDELYNVIDLPREGNTCTAIMRASMLPFNGKYTMQLRGISGDKVYHTDTFDVWVKYSIDPSKVYDPIPSEFYQIEQTVTEQAAQAANAAQTASDAAAGSRSAAQAAEMAATAAEGAATTAENAKTIAVDAKDKALTAERNAKDSETNAVNAAKSAAQSANDANVAANIAVSASNSAKASEDAANESRIAAESAKDASVQNAKQSADSAVAAKLSEDNAKQSETGAKSAQSTAEQNAKDAVNAKTAAETAQKSAQESASNAAQSAKDAKTANEFAQDAQQSAVEAAQLSVAKALEAAQSAVDAKASADSAKQAADRALTIIDDNALTRDKTWSSRNIVDMVCPAIKETGNPVVCTPVPNYPLGVKANWVPIQEGSGEPSPDNIRPVKGRDSVMVERKEDSLTRNITLPSTIYGGEVDAATGEGVEQSKAIQLDGTEKIIKYGAGESWSFYYFQKAGISSKQGKQLCSHFQRAEIVNEDIVRLYATSLFGTVDEFRAYLAAQYTAGTPVQIVYRVSEPTPFAATGGAPIPPLNGTNTILTDADSVTVTGRETPQSYIDRKLTETNTAIAAL